VKIGAVKIILCLGVRINFYPSDTGKIHCIVPAAHNANDHFPVSLKSEQERLRFSYGHKYVTICYKTVWQSESKEHRASNVTKYSICNIDT